MARKEIGMKVLFSQSVCSCQVCKDMCKNPCIPVPEEAEKLIQAGYGSRLTNRLVFDSRTYEDVEILVPANPGFEGCTFRTLDGLCELHSLDLKPLEGRLANHNTPSGYGLNEYVKSRWNCDLGREIVTKWKELVNHEHSSTLTPKSR